LHEDLEEADEDELLKVESRKVKRSKASKRFSVEEEEDLF
jgi:hypothetical protein